MNNFFCSDSYYNNYSSTNSDIINRDHHRAVYYCTYNNIIRREADVVALFRYKKKKMWRALIYRENVMPMRLVRVKSLCGISTTLL